MTDFWVSRISDGRSCAVREGRTLVVVDDISQVVSAAVVRLADAHGVVGEVDIAIVA